MIVTVASGKGGTGKTTIAVNLALSAPYSTRLVDCDVEEPNAHIFVKPTVRHREPVYVTTPVVDEALCTDCGECGRICQFHAIVSLRTKPLVFPELCHSCGGCSAVCPENAITETPREVGTVELGEFRGAGGSVAFSGGRLRVGEPMAVPVIRATKKGIFTNSVGDKSLTIIDAPPGTSCPVVAATKGSDFVILVAEPTPFGLNDLALAVELVRAMGLPTGVVIMKSTIGDSGVRDFCGAKELPILAEIPEDRRIAEASSKGEAAVCAVPETRGIFERLLQNVLKEGM